MKAKILSVSDRAWWTLLFIVLGALLIAGSMSCNSSRRAEKRIAKARIQRPDLFAKACAEAFPVQTYDSVEIRYIPGQEVTRRDTVRVDCSEIAGDSNQVMYIPCPPCLTRTDTLLRTWTQVRENTARVNQYQQERDASRLEASSVRQSLKYWRWGAILLLAYILIRAIVRRVFKLILP